MTVAPASDALTEWFAGNGWQPFEFQREVWDAYADGRSGLIHAATGTGKTYAAWIGPVQAWLDANPAAPVAKKRASHAPLQVLWITPLRALAADTEQALRAPIEALQIPWTIESRTGDTVEKVRRAQRDRLPSALITTPESLELLLCREDQDTVFESLQCVIVDEWHELMATKRGVQVELALARLRMLCPTLRTWGLSATLGNLEVARETLLGLDATGNANPGVLVRGIVPKSIHVEALLPGEMERFPWAGQLNTKLLPQVIERIEAAQSAIIFTNTRAQCEIWYQSILTARPDWLESVAIHHGSLDKKQRTAAEDGLKSGRFRAVVATSSLDLGVDFAPVDLVMQIGSPKGVARLLQRAGRSGHSPGRVSQVICVPTHALELIEVAAARDAIRAGHIESRNPVDRPLDLLSQHLVTRAIGGGFTRPEIMAEVRTTRAYGQLTDAELDWVLDFITRGGEALRAYPEYSRVTNEYGHYFVSDTKVIARHRMSIGTIVSDAALSVRFLTGGRLGTIEESFIARLKPKDRFIFSGRALEFVRVKDLTAWVRKAKSADGAFPSWSGTRVPLTTELSLAVREKLEEARLGRYTSPEMQAVRNIMELQASRSIIPALDELLIERLDSREGHHLFIYPFDGRLVHEGLSALFAYRIAQLAPITFSFACNDYGFELVSPEPIPIEDALESGLLSTGHLLHDITASLNAAELARRQFREIARVAGLIFQGFPGQNRSMKQVQASSGL
ncbi:MAG TPA: ligase-associated DNA damage response DEXH box helicase, partial [Gemmatimonadaceae bacterium]|nr:ligase-associated DNA damage response DEXH box helicase [Gemmatimonadaceae bacterium]